MKKLLHKVLHHDVKKLLQSSCPDGSGQNSGPSDTLGRAAAQNAHTILR
jgi:hypothetical protein